MQKDAEKRLRTAEKNLLLPRSAGNTFKEVYFIFIPRSIREDAFDVPVRLAERKKPGIFLPGLLPSLAELQKGSQDGLGDDHSERYFFVDDLRYPKIACRTEQAIAIG